MESKAKKDDSMFESHVQHLLAHHAIQFDLLKQQTIKPELMECNTSSLDIRGLPPCHGPQLESILPLPLFQLSAPSSSHLSIPISSSPLSNTNDVSFSSTTQAAEASSDVESTPSNLLSLPTPVRRKRARQTVDYAALENGDDLSYEDVSEEMQAKRPKLKSDPPSPVPVAPEVLSGVGASRRFGSRLHALFLWFDEAKLQKADETPFPSVSCLSDIFIDLPSLDLSIELADEVTSSKFIACLRLVFKLCSNEHVSELTVLSAVDSRSTASAMGISVQVGMLASLCMLYLLTHPSFDRRHLSDECLDETCQTIIATLTGFVQPILYRSDDGTLLTSSASNAGTGASHSKSRTSKRKKEDPLDTPCTTSSTSFLASSVAFSWQKSVFSHLMAQTLGLVHESLDFLCKLLEPISASCSTSTTSMSSLPEEHTMSIMKIVRISLFSYGLQTSLQSTAMRVFRSLFHAAGASYHQYFIQEILDAIVDLNRGTQNPSELKHESLHIVTSTVLQVLHASSESLLLPSSSSLRALQAQVSLAEENYQQHALTTTAAHQSKSRPSSLCRYFVKHLFDAILDRNDFKDDIYAAVLDRVVVDLIGVIFRPEWPAAELLLKDVLQHILAHLSSHHHHAHHGSSSGSHHLHGHASNSVSTGNQTKISERLKTTLGTWLSLIGTKLVSAKLFMTTANLTRRPSQGDAETRLLQEGARCPLCTGTYSGKRMASCTRCLRWFHVECFGIIEPPQDLGSEWFCDACLEGWVYDMLPPNQDSCTASLGTVKGDTTTTEGGAIISGPMDDVDPYLPTSSSSPSSMVDQSSNFDVKRLHFAMKILILNLLNDKTEKLSDMVDSKRFLLRQWLLENEESNRYAAMMESLVLGQWDSSSTAPIHWPLGPFKPSNDEIEANGYIRILSQYMQQTASARNKVGLLPSQLASQIFLIRFSMASTTSTSIFAFFPKIMDQFVSMMNLESAKFRTLALRAITNMVEADMTLLRDKHVYDAVEARLIDPSPLTREKALNMLGRFIVMNPNVIPQYAALIRDRVEDSSISVRKRAVRIIRSICLLVPSSPHVVTFCTALAKRTSRHGEGIKNLVLNLLKELWFVSDEGKKTLLNEATDDLMDPDLPKADLSVSMTSTIGDEGDVVKRYGQSLSTFEKVDQMLSILKETLRSEPDREASWFVELMEHVKMSDFGGSSVSASVTSDGDGASVSNSSTVSSSKPSSSSKSKPSRLSRLSTANNASTMSAGGNPFLVEIVGFLVDFLCGIGEEADLEYERHRKCEQLVEEHSHNTNMKRAAQAALMHNKEDWIKKRLLYSIALSYIARCLPHLVAEHFHHLRMLLSVETPTPTTHALEKKILETVLGILETIIPIVRHPSDDIWTSILKDISQLLKNHGMPVIAASVKCAAAVSRRTKSSNWIKSLYIALAASLKAEIQHSSSTVGSHNKANGARGNSIVESSTTSTTRTSSSSSSHTAQTATNTNNNNNNNNPTSSILHPQSIIRFMFTLSMILKCHPLDQPSNFREKDLSTVDSIRSYRYGPHIEEVYSFIVYFWKHGDRDVQTSAVLSLGHLAPGSPGIFVRTVSEEIITSALSTSSLEQLKAQALKTIYEFLSEEAERMKFEAAQMSTTNRRASSATTTTSSSFQRRKSTSASDSHAPAPLSSGGANRRSTRRRRSSASNGVDFEFGSDSLGPNEHHEQDSLDNVMDDDGEYEGESDLDTGRPNDLGDDSKRSSSSSSSHHSADMGLSSTIVELYMKRVLTLGLDKSIAIRNAALTLLEHILKMGLTHPAHCVPTLVALETDDVLGEFAHRCLSTLDMARVLNRIAVGIQLSFQFQRTIYRTPKAIRPVSEGGVVTYHSNLGRMYLLFAELGRVARNNFLAAAFGLFESHSEKKGSSGFDALFITYLTLLIAQLPFATVEEALYAVYQCNVSVSHLGLSSLNRLKLFYHTEIYLQNPTTLCPPEADVQDAIIAWHLLMLKLFLRSFYALDSERCRNYMPTETQSTPIPSSVVYTNIQEYIHKINPNFEGFLQDSGSNHKRPEACKRIYKNLKAAFKAQEDDHGHTKTERTRTSRRRATAGLASETTMPTHSSPQQHQHLQITARGINGSTPHEHRIKTPTKSASISQNGHSKTPKTTSSKKLRKRAIKYGGDEDEDYEG